MPARRPSGRESKWAGTRRRIPQGPVKNNPPHPTPPHPISAARTTRSYRFTAVSVEFFFPAERRSAEWRLLFLFTSGKFVSAGDRGTERGRGPVSLSESQRKHASFTAADTRGLFTRSHSRPRRKEGRHWTGRVNKSRRSHYCVTFPPSTANSGSSPRTCAPTPAIA